MEKDNSLILPASILFAGIMISGSIIYSNGGIAKNPNNNSANISGNNNTASLTLSDRDVVLGNEDAAVTVIVYADYQCPFCGKFFTESEGKIRSDYVNAGKVKLVHRNYTFIDRFPGVTGDESHLAAEAAECARDQGKFWDYHDALYVEENKDAKENNGNLNKALFLRLAQNLSLDSGTFEKCIDTRKYKDLIERDSEAANAVGVESTPTVFINGVEIRGAQPYDKFKAAIDRALQES